MDDILEQVLEGTGFSTDGYGMDSNLVCDEDGTYIEQDCPACPECGRLNPLRAMGMI